MTLCTFENCRIRGIYGIKQQQPTRCKVHKLDGMVTRSTQYCEHNKIRSRCKDCKGGCICEHDKRSSQCKECGGSQIFKHEKQSSHCRECNGGGICEHDKVRSRCKKCKGGCICEHDKIRSQCKECGGSQICKHEKQCSHCRICSPNSKYFCLECHYTTGNKKYKGYCVPCYVYKFPDDPISNEARLKHAELKVKAFLAIEFPGIFTHNSRIWLGDCSAPYRRFIDFYVIIGNTLFVIEVDERQHRRYDIADEQARINEILHNIGVDKKMVFIRYNPDSYKVNGKQKRTSNGARLLALKDKVVEVLEQLYSDNEYEDIHTEIKMFYDITS
jgi:hypothetical protein